MEAINSTDVDSILIEANRHQSLDYLASIILVSVCLGLGTVGNTIICVVYSFKVQKSNSNIFIRHLAIYDLTVCIIVLPFMLSLLLNTYTFNSPVVCKICLYTEYVFTGASSLILISIALDRYNKICRPLRLGLSERVSKWLFFITLITGASLSCLVPLLYGDEQVLYQDEAGLKLIGTTCGIKNSFRGSTLHIVHIYVMLSGFLLINFFMIVFYCLVGVKLWKRGRQIQDNRGPRVTLGGHSIINFNSYDVNVVPNETVANKALWTNQSSAPDLCRLAKMFRQKRMDNGSKTSLMLFLVSLTFLLTWLPFWIIAVQETQVEPGFNISLPQPADSGLSRFGRSLFLLNHAVNPIIYSVVSKTFRTDCRHSFTRLVLKLRIRMT